MAAIPRTNDDDRLNGTQDSDVIPGLGGDDRLHGERGSDSLYGGEGDDRLNGGIGSDLMVGGTGNDVYFIINAGGQVIEAAGEGADTVYAKVDYALAAGE